MAGVFDAAAWAEFGRWLDAISAGAASADGSLGAAGAVVWTHDAVADVYGMDDVDLDHFHRELTVEAAAGADGAPGAIPLSGVADAVPMLRGFHFLEDIPEGVYYDPECDVLIFDHAEADYCFPFHLSNVPPPPPRFMLPWQPEEEPDCDPEPLYLSGPNPEPNHEEDLFSVWL